LAHLFKVFAAHGILHKRDSMRPQTGRLQYLLPGAVARLPGKLKEQRANNFANGAPLGACGVLEQTWILGHTRLRNFIS